MTLDLLIIGLMALGIVVFVAEPLLRHAPAWRIDDPDSQEVEALQLQKETLYTAIRDLDFDFQTGKVDQHDYIKLRRALENEAVHVLRQLDALDPVMRLDQELEQQIALLREQDSQAAPSQKACKDCEVPLRGDENFCPICGRMFT